MEATLFNQAQIHVLKMMSHIKSEKALDELKEQLTAYYARRIDEDMDDLWDKGVWNEQTLNEISHSHLRTPYK